MRFSSYITATSAVLYAFQVQSEAFQPRRNSAAWWRLTAGPLARGGANPGGQAAATLALAVAIDPNDEQHHPAELALTYQPKTNSAFARYQAEYKRSLDQPESFWAEKALQFLHWETPFQSVLPSKASGFEQVHWFSGGKLNMCYNAIDRHVEAGKGNDMAMVWEGDEPDDIRRLTFNDMLARVSQIANALKAKGVGKGDVVTLYMPMIPELPLTMLACARIGAIHSVVFAGFSADALAQRISAASSKFLVTADQGIRGGKRIPLLDIVHSARSKWNLESTLEQVFVWERFYDKSQPDTLSLKPNEAHMNALTDLQRPYCPPTIMDAEDTLFVLYTSGSTGQPKALVHTTGGYALWAAFTARTTFDFTPGDLFACVADCGWITGHTYVVYGPLLNGITTFVFESTPLYPTPARYWEMIERHQITQFYTAPTAIRSLMRYGDDIPQQYAMASLKVLGTVGEPINAAAWDWYYQFVGKERCTLVDTYWQTETGGHIITNIPGVTPMKPGSCSFPMYGIEPVILDATTGREVDQPSGQAVEGVLAIRRPWPGMARSCLGDHPRFETVYLKPYPGYYFTGDAVYKDKDGYFFITGRVDDVLNVSGHRIGTAEVESALVAHPAVAQAAVVGKPHPIKGEAITGFVMLDVDQKETPELLAALRNEVRAEIGPFASPDILWIVPSLPMTRSGKIMRRILRKIVAGETDSLGDISTLADPSIVQVLIDKVKESEAALTR